MALTKKMWRRKAAYGGVAIRENEMKSMKAYRRNNR